jgi:hypothetical protein
MSWEYIILVLCSHCPFCQVWINIRKTRGCRERSLSNEGGRENFESGVTVRMLG